MKLTGKCKEKFIFWMCKNHEYVRWHEYETMPECYINALIIDFFDSVGIWDELFEREYLNEKESFKIICNNVITKANEIYNET